MPQTKDIIFTPEEKNELAQAVRDGAAALVRIWDALAKASDRIGSDWEPKSTSAADILDIHASSIDGPEGADTITDDNAVSLFQPRVHWR